MLVRTIYTVYLAGFAKVVKICITFVNLTRHDTTELLLLSGVKQNPLIQCERKLLRSNAVINSTIDVIYSVTDILCASIPRNQAKARVNINTCTTEQLV